MEVIINAAPGQSVPVAILVEWMSAEQAKIQNDQLRAESMRQGAGLQGIDISRDLDGMAREIRGRKDTLDGLGALIISVTEPIESPDQA